jgi:Ca-activated chloride channel family protein
VTGVAFDPVLSPVLIAVLAAVGCLVAAWPRLQGRRDRRGWPVRLLLVPVLGVLLLHPVLEGTTTATAGSVPARQVLVVLDRTTSMSALDRPDGRPRLDGVRADLAALTDTLGGARFALVTWGRSVREVLPFTSDRAAFSQAVELTEAEDPRAGAGSSVDRPLPEVTEILRRAAEQHPERGLVLLVLSDGEDTSGDPPRSWASLAPLVDGGAVLGYGTAAGGTMPRDGGRPGAGPLLVDPRTGEPAVSRLDEDNLRRIARDLGVPYLHRSTRGGLARWAASLPEPDATLRRRAAAPVDPAWVLGLLVLALALVELRRWWRELHAVRREGRR